MAVSSDERLRAALRGEVADLRQWRASEHWSSDWFQGYARELLLRVELEELAAAPVPLFVPAELADEDCARAREFLLDMGARVLADSARFDRPPVWLAELTAAHWMTDVRADARERARGVLWPAFPQAASATATATHLLGALIEDLAELGWRLLRLGPGGELRVLTITDREDFLDVLCGPERVSAVFRDGLWHLFARGHTRVLDDAKMPPRAGVTSAQYLQASRARVVRDARELVRALADPYRPDAWEQELDAHRGWRPAQAS